MARAKQDLFPAGPETSRGASVLSLLIHGDAAFCQIRAWSPKPLSLSMLPGYRTGGTVHLVVNNQVGFTTSPESARSILGPRHRRRQGGQAPIFHVNGDDPRRAVRVARLALAFRQAFHKDVVIDMVCYRRLRSQRGRRPELHPAADVRAHRARTRRSVTATPTPW